MKKDKLINKIIYRLSYSGRRERNLKETSDNISKYMNMSDDEFIMEYTEVCSRYEHKKLILTVISIGLIISMISNIWKYFYEDVYKRQPLIYNQKIYGMIGIDISFAYLQKTLAYDELSNSGNGGYMLALQTKENTYQSMF